MAVINKDSTVSMHFDLRLKDGSIAESSRTIGQPMEFQMGQGVFSDKMEQQLLGLSVGDKSKIMLMPEDAFGISHPASIYQVPLRQFKGELAKQLEVGLIVVFTQPNGTELPGVIRALDEHEATVDFNHPLAGQVVLFDLEIIDVK